MNFSWLGAFALISSSLSSCGEVPGAEGGTRVSTASHDNGEARKGVVSCLPSYVETGPAWSPERVISTKVAGLSIGDEISKASESVVTLEPRFPQDDMNEFLLPFYGVEAKGSVPWLPTFRGIVEDGDLLSLSAEDLLNLASESRRSSMNRDLEVSRTVSEEGKMTIGEISFSIPRPVAPEFEQELIKRLGHPTYKFDGEGCSSGTFYVYGPKKAPSSAEEFLHYLFCAKHFGPENPPEIDCSVHKAPNVPWIGVLVSDEVANVYVQDGKSGYFNIYQN